MCIDHNKPYKMILYDMTVYKNIIEGKLEAKIGRGRLRISYKSQLKEKVAVMSYNDVKEAALEITEWKKIHRLCRQESNF